MRYITEIVAEEMTHTYGNVIIHTKIFYTKHFFLVQLITILTQTEHVLPFTFWIITLPHASY